MSTLTARTHISTPPSYRLKPPQSAWGLYALFGAAVLLQNGAVAGQTDYIGQYLPVFQDLNTLLNTKGLSFSPVEIFMALVLLIWLFRSLAAGKLDFDRGSLLRPLGLYMLMVMFGEVLGLASGVDYRFSLWEIRAQVYMFVAYILTCNLVKRRTQMNALLWILLIGSGLRAIEGTYRYFFIQHGTIGTTYNELYPHEQAFMWNAGIIATLILLLYGSGPRLMQRVALLFLPFVIATTLVNNRRAAIVAIGVAIPVMLLVTLIAHPPRRRIVGLILLGLAIVFPPYYAIYQNKSGSIAMPARAIASNFNPDPRDASSNQDRVWENNDIMATVKQSALTQIIGTGYGKPMLMPFSLADVTRIYLLEPYLPHNSILWVWMRLGTIGYLLLWFMIGTALVQAICLLRRLGDPFLRGVALLVPLVLMQQIIFGYLDIGWTNYRNMIVTGVLLALISRLSMFEAASVPHPSPLSGPRPSRRVRIHVPSTLTIVDGRLKH